MGAILGLSLSFIALSFAPFFVSDYMFSILLDILKWVALTVSWVILSGFTGYISLGHAAFFGLGAYAMAVLWGGLPFPLLLLFGGLTSAFVALAIGFPCLTSSY